MKATQLAFFFIVAIGLAGVFATAEAPKKRSEAGRCGTHHGVNYGSCKDAHGACCSKDGFCGPNESYCGAESCLSGLSLFGHCNHLNKAEPKKRSDQQGRCGVHNGINYGACTQAFAGCCSKDGFCGSTEPYCGVQSCLCGLSLNGHCNHPTASDIIIPKPSQEGRCGIHNGINYGTCNQAFAACCSREGYCGRGDAYCGVASCDSGFSLNGNCNHPNF